jgi:RNA polymerase sigma factor (sigma-70 family)
VKEDAETIEAIKQGDHERFAELVDRHQRLAYAIAWSRLGDAALAEEAAQESFIQAFRYLGALRQPDRFAGWLGRIVRNAAGMINRREGREKATKALWALDQEMESGSGDPPDSAPLPEDVESALADLSDEHREALVLFYFKGESTVSAAEILEVNEGTFRTRLSRARSKLRKAIERRTEAALGKLRPARNLTPLVIASLPAAPFGANAAGVAGAIGGKVAGTLLKGSVWFALLPLLQIPLAWGLALFSNRAMVRSFRDPHDKRAELMRDSQIFNLLMVAFIMLGSFLLFLGGLHLGVGERAIDKLLALALSVYCVSVAIRQLRVDRGLDGIAMGAMSLLMVTGMISVVFFDGESWLWYIWLIPSGLLPLIAPSCLATARIDNNLFLRQALGGMGDSGQAPETPVLELSNSDLRRFAWWLGGKKLLFDRDLGERGMTLCLADVRITAAQTLRTWRSRSESSIFVTRSGKCSGGLSQADHYRIMDIVPEAVLRDELESKTVAVFQSATTAYFTGDLDQAERLLTKEPDSQVFHRNPLRTWPIIGFQLLMVALGGWLIFKGLNGGFSYRPRGARGAVPEFAEPAALKVLQPMLLGFNAYPKPTNSSLLALLAEWRCGKISFSESHLGDRERNALRGFLSKQLTRDGIRELGSSVRHWPYSVPVMHRVLLSGLFSPEEISAWGFDRSSIREAFARLPVKKRHERIFHGWGKIRHRHLWSYGIHSDSWQILEILRHFDSLDLVNADLIAAEISLLQVNAEEDPVPRIDATLNLDEIHGLFVTRKFSLEHNWYLIRILSALGKLDRIDREAFVSGILRLHHGEGLIGERSRKHGFRVNGYAEITFYVLDCLLQLEAGDQVDDLGDWKFRAQAYSHKPGTPPIQRPDLIAWIYQQRLAEILRMPNLPLSFF